MKLRLLWGSSKKRSLVIVHRKDAKGKILKDNGKRRKTLEESRKICERMREKRVSVVESIHQFNEVLDIERLLKKLPLDIKNTKREIEESKVGLAELHPRLERDSGYSDELQKAVDEKEESLRTLKSEVSHLKMKLERHEGKNALVENLKDEISELEAQRDAVNLRIERLKPGVETLKNETSSLKEKLTEDTGELHKLEPRKQMLNLDVDALNEKINTLGDLETKKKNLANTIEDNNQITGKISALKSGFEQDNQNKSNINEEISSLDGEVGNLGSEVETLTSRADDLRNTVIPKDEVDGLQNNLNNTEKERDNIKERIVTVNSEIENHLSSKGDIIQEVQDAKAEMESLQEEFDKLSEKIDLYEKHPDQLERLKNKVPELEKTSKEYAKRAKNAGEELKHLNNAIDIMSTELKAYKEAMQQINELMST